MFFTGVFLMVMIIKSAYFTRQTSAHGQQHATNRAGSLVVVIEICFVGDWVSSTWGQAESHHLNVNITLRLYVFESIVDASLRFLVIMHVILYFMNSQRRYVIYIKM